MVLDAAQVRAALPMRLAIDAMRQAFALLAQGRVDLPVRTQVSLPGGAGSFLVMPVRADTAYGLGAKLVTVLPGNSAAGRPVVQAVVVLLDQVTGELVALLEGTSLTAIRTGAASGLATDLLARKDARRLTIIGSGVQARTQLEGVCAVRDIERVTIWSRTREHARQFAADVRAVGVVPEVEVAGTVAAAVEDADVMCLATSALRPVLAAWDVPEGVHVNAIGSFRPDMQEFEPALLQRARVVVDQKEAALAEAGEVIEAVRGGLVNQADLLELGQVLAGQVTGRESAAQITVFKSVGLAVQDLAAAGQVARFQAPA
ncbi:MAG TPA: hypothetical protein VD793_11915 [Gemmatimonadales bacterium]|nr:hypothetical protein [Gemmatimonadales bacterium]